MSVYLRELSKPHSVPKTRKSRFWIHVLLLLLIGAYLRAWSMNNESPSFDEAMAAIISEVSFGSYVGQAQPDYCPPFFYMISHPVAISSMTLGALRVISIIAGALSPLALYLVGRRLYGESAAAIAAYLLMLNPLHIYYSQELQPSATFAFFGIFAFLAMVRSAESNRWKDWALYDILAIALLHTQREAPFFIAAFPLIQLCRALFFPPANQERRMHRFRLIQGILLNHFIIIAVSIPWLVIMPNKPQWEMAIPTLDELIRIFGEFYLFGFSGWRPLAPWLTAVLLVLLMLPPLAKTLRRLDFRTFAAIAALLLAIALPFIYSLFESPRFVPEREGFTALPYFCLSLGILLARCNWLVKSGLVSLFTVIFLSSSIHQARTLQKTATTDMLSAIIKDGADKDSVVAFWPDYTLNLGVFWRDYYNHSFNIATAKDVLKTWAEVPDDKPIYFVVSQFPGNTPHLYTFQGALAQYSESQVLWQNRLNMVIKASDINQQTLAQWYDEPRSLKILDQPTSNTQFIFTAGSEVFKPPVIKEARTDSKGNVLPAVRMPDSQWPFAYDSPNMSYDPTGHRFVWTTEPTVELELPVTLAPGQYMLRLHCSPDFDQPEHGRYKDRTVKLTLRSGVEVRNVELSHADTVSLAFTTDVELDKLRVSIGVDKTYDVGPPSPGTYGLKIYSISVDQSNPTGGSEQL